MAFRDLTMGIIFFTQTTLGILGNSALLCHFFLADFTARKAKPTVLIVKHLTWANLMVLLCKGIPQTVAAFGLIYILDDISCKLIFYVYRIARGVSLGSISLLGVIQVITISPYNSKWGQLKVTAPKVIGAALGLCWALHLLGNVPILMRMNVMLVKRNMTGLRDILYCAVVDPPSVINILNTVVLTSVDVMCEALMAWASGSMVLVLWKHRKRVQHIHSSLSARSSPETRATQRILVLVSSFVCFYVTSVFLNMCFPFLDRTTRWQINANVAMSVCFASFCPFLLLIQYSIVPRLCCSCSYQTSWGPHIERGL